MPKRQGVVFLLLAFLFLGCQPTAEVVEEPIADIAALEAFIQDYINTYNSGDWQGALAHFADDAVQMPPNGQAFVGMEEIRSFWEEYETARTSPVQWALIVDDVEVSGDLGFIRSSWTALATAKDSGETTETRGRNLLVFRREAGGGWKIIVGSFSQEPAEE
jgi:uncharacterized protein (TIGR02246 family)